LPRTQYYYCLLPTRLNEPRTMSNPMKKSMRRLTAMANQLAPVPTETEPNQGDGMTRAAALRGNHPVLNSIFGMGENRAERLETSQAQALFKGTFRAFGGEEKVRLKLKEHQEKEEWINKMPGPHHEMGEIEAFKYFLESNPHGDNHTLMQDWAEKYGAQAGGNCTFPFMVVGWNVKPEVCHWLMVNHLEDHKKVAEEHLPKTPAYDAITYGHNFLAVMDTSEDGEWRRRRLGAVHAVQPMHIKKYFHKMERHARMMVQKLQDPDRGTFMYSASSPDPAFNVHDLFAETAFAIAAENLFGLDDETIAQWSRPVRWALQRVETSNKKAVDILKGWAQLLREWPEEKKGPLLQALTELHYEEKPAETYVQAGWFANSDKDMHDDVGVLSLAMHDTTTSSMTSCIMELARRPELQAEVAREARKVLSTRSMDNVKNKTMAETQHTAATGTRAMVYDDLYNMPLLTKCINETLRMWSVVPFGTQRQLDADTELHCGPGPDDTTMVPKGTNVMVPNWVHHRSKELWGPDADEWKPERWEGFADIGGFHFEGEEGTQDHHATTYAARNPESYRFHPFTRAPRDCFGKNFAQAEMRVVLPVLLSQLKFSLAEPTSTIVDEDPNKVMFQLTGVLKPRDGLWVHVEPRESDE